ncbi:nucleopolyhedrovirus P10 family protein [Streptomyces alfalfae]|uniref:Nucleopolyhedrovirus P10 family protein n=1 Tax=Streptomyces alfalfae TaxID=1642299 RepID=A0A7T4PE96_9ACTN|nr:nucleopolyhedrovirus P10 family protein [Streptomyces alfalfae]QQC88616.1 nucleopolyhedrovirus P10 family protein [Streptomyces alfalfae]
MTGDGWPQAVRRQLGLGRVLPLGGPEDGTWVTEAAADGALRAAARDVSGVRLGTLRIAPADPEDTRAPVVPPPPSALPPGPLRITADFAAVATAPLPAAADRLRAALRAAADRLGLVAPEVDLRVTALLDDARDAERVTRKAPAGARQEPDEGATAAEDSSDAARAARAALAVPGVSRLTRALGPAVHLEERPGANALPRRHARVELATGGGHRALDVALAVRAAVAAALPDHPSVAVLVTGAE